MLTATREFVPAQTDNSWGTHFRASIYLGVPFIGAQLAQLAINTTDVLMVGRLGAVQLAAIILATQFFFTVFIFGSGFANAVVPMVAQAQGRGDRTLVRRSVRMGMWVVLLYGLITAPVLWMAEPILLLAGQKPEVSALAAEYLRIAQWAIFPSLIFMVLRAFLAGLERAGIILYVTLATLVLNAVLCYVLIYGHFGFPALGIFGAAVAALGVALLGAALTIGYIGGQPELNRYELFVRFWRPDWPAFREVIYLGVPISVTILAEVSLFTVASLLMGTIGTIELAAHGIALQFASIAFMIPLGLAQAGTVRVGLAYGSGDLVGVRRSAVAVLALGSGFAAIGSTIFALLPYQLATLYLDTGRPDAAEVLAFAGPLIVIAGAFQLVDGLQAIAAGMLRGLKDTTVPMIMAMISYWPIGFVCAWAFAFPLNFGGVGVWFGFVLGLAAAALLLNWRFFRLIQSLRAQTAA
ncbi:MULTISPECIES: MATE family efflux transporter [Sinorhizobium]|uniref:MATE family efflux transporter n=1 Tax=Sinorhizobium TaxID=28105 RepID=UPI000BE7F012|nr:MULTISPECIES: MATE family efflux transporter [Sinorhizobium]PDT54944.1 MATE family efflux transporter [Sinorhizobium sp. NG07B]POH31987.1 MATE family efflux transporter [Sinorhizobium americanum]